MINIREKWEEDEEYIYSRAEKIGKRPTQAQVESFCERVAMKTQDNEMSDTDARNEAFKLVMK